MSDVNSAIRSQLCSCKSLMNIFQNERKMLLNKSFIDTQDVLPILKLKQRLMGTFESQQTLMGELKTSPKLEVKTEKSEQKNLLSKLGKMIEELLVIDKENELLIKKLLKNATVSSPSIDRNYVKKTDFKKTFSSNSIEVKNRIGGRVYGGSRKIRAYSPERVFASSLSKAPVSL